MVTLFNVKSTKIDHLAIDFEILEPYGNENICISPCQAFLIIVPTYNKPENNGSNMQNLLFLLYIHLHLKRALK